MYVYRKEEITMFVQIYIGFPILTYLETGKSLVGRDVIRKKILIRYTESSREVHIIIRVYSYIIREDLIFYFLDVQQL